MEYDIRCYTSPTQNLYHASHLFAGLCGLEEQGRIRVRFIVPSRAEAIYVGDELTVCLQVRREDNGEPVTLAVDLHDQSDTFATALLDECDLYFKRSYNDADVAALSDDRGRKVVPFGLNYGCRTRVSTRRVLAALGPHMAWDCLQSPAVAAARLNPRRSTIYQYLTSARERDFERKPAQQAEPAILFQTRVYKPEEIHPDDPTEVNEGRVTLVRALKKAFGPRFHGGLVPTTFAKERYPDAVSDAPSRQRQYLEWGKKCLVGVYTRGLFHSLAFKLPEYLAASMCIVTEPLRNRLPVPLVAGRHYLEFGTPEECVERCAELLRDSARAAAMRNDSWSYYRSHVAPVAHVAAILGQADSIATRREGS